MMRSLVSLLAAAVAACVAAAEPAAAQVEGSYLLVEINGHALPTPSPTEDGLLMHKMSLLLMGDGRFFLIAKASLEGDPQQVDDAAEGTYEVTDDSLALTAEDDPAKEPLTFRFTLADGTLRLYDPAGHEYTFRRQH